MRKLFISLLAGSVVMPAFGYEVTDKLSVGATVTGVVQHGDFSNTEVGDKTRGTVVTDLGVNFHPTNVDEFYVLVSFAADNALNRVSPLTLAPYADDLEDALKDINGRNRDFLLNAWYKRSFVLSEESELGLTGGIIDSTDYLDDNAFANDEVSQFMNDIFVNNTLANLPSYDIGIAGELDVSERWAARFVWMNSKNVNDDPAQGPLFDRNFHYVGGQLGYHNEGALGEGNYRVYAFTTDAEFINEAGDDFEPLRGVGLSLDQELGPTYGVFARFGWQDDEAVVAHDQVYSVGLNVGGRLWGRADDEAGLAFAYLDGAGSGGIDDTQAVEGYVKFQLWRHADLSFDIQYMDDDFKQGSGPDAAIYGVRFNAYF